MNYINELANAIDVVANSANSWYFSLEAGKGRYTERDVIVTMLGLLTDQLAFVQTVARSLADGDFADGCALDFESEPMPF